MKSIFSIFQRGLQKTATSIGRTIAGVFGDIKTWDAKAFDDLEAAMLLADFGVAAGGFAHPGAVCGYAGAGLEPASQL